MYFYQNDINEVKLCKREFLPEQFRRLALPFATYHLNQGNFGSVLSQEIEGKGFKVWQHHFFIMRPFILTAYNDTPMISINYMLEGSPYAKLPGKHEYLLEEGKYRLFFVPEIAHPVSFVEGSFNCIHIDFNPEALKTKSKRNHRLNNLLSYIIQDGSRLLPFLSGEIGEYIKNCLVEILWYNGNDRQEYINRLTYRLLLQYVLKHHAVKDDMSELEKFIDRNLAEHLTIHELTEFACKSERAFFREFKRQFNTSPKQYILKKRMDRAQRYLHSTILPISQIALLVGYDNPQSFHKIFWKHFGISPEAFRRKGAQ